MKNSEKKFLKYRQLPFLPILAACMALSAGCASMHMLGSIVSAEFTKAPAEERSVARLENAEIPGPEAPIPVRIYTPAGAGPFPVLMYFHGGGWTGGSPLLYDDLCRFLCNRASCVVVSVDYRLAPKYTFPAGFEDVYAATLWARDNPGRLNSDPDRLAVAGESAGGNLAAAVALAARNRGGPKLVLQVLAFAATDLASLDTDSYLQNNAEAGLTREKVIYFRDQYLQGPADRINPYVSPLRAADHHSLPPALIIVGEKDVARDDGLHYGAALEKSGVRVRTVMLSGQGHAVVPWATASEQARPALDATVQALKEAYSGTLLKKGN
jgi:acetyl esterase